MLSLCLQPSIQIWISAASYFISYTSFLELLLIGCRSLQLLTLFVVQPESCSGPSASLPVRTGFGQVRGFTFRWCHNLVIPLIPSWDFDSKNCRERKEESFVSLKSKSTSDFTHWLCFGWGLLDVTADLCSPWAGSVTDFADVPTCPH